jgi:hypothetical protein
VAVISLIGVIVKSRSDIAIARIPIDATSTAEARLTEIGKVTDTPQVGIPPTETSTPELRKMQLETIQFDYADPPMNHGWQLVEGNPQLITFEKLNDATVGNALKISSPSDNTYALDYILSPQSSEFGNSLELVANYYDAQTSFYVYVSMVNNNGDIQSGWLKLKIGKDQALPSQKTVGEQEWLLYVKPEAFLDQNWVQMQIDLTEAVQETFGKDGWTFKKLLRFRIRGNLWIDYITIYEN